MQQTSKQEELHQHLRMVIEVNIPAVGKQLPMPLYHHPLNHQYKLQSIQMLLI